MSTQQVPDFLVTVDTQYSTILKDKLRHYILVESKHALPNISSFNTGERIFIDYGEDEGNHMEIMFPLNNSVADLKKAIAPHLPNYENGFNVLFENKVYGDGMILNEMFQHVKSYHFRRIVIVEIKINVAFLKNSETQYLAYCKVLTPALNGVGVEIIKAKEDVNDELFITHSNEKHFKPITVKEKVPFYNSVIDRKSSYHHSVVKEGLEHLKAYSGSFYWEVNLRMLLGMLKHNQHLTDYENQHRNEMREKLSLMYSAVFSAYQLNLPNKVFRKCLMSSTELQWYKECEKKNIYLPSFTSTSRTLLNWHSNGTVIVFLLKPGNRNHVMDISHLSHFKHESEILINPATCCYVDEVDVDNKIIYLVFND